MTDRVQIAIPLFPKFTALDAVGPYEVLQRIPTFDITFLGHARGELRSENGMLGLTADATLEEMPEPDVVVFPGGVGTRALEHDERVLDWVRHAHAGTRYTASVCTGSLVLGAAGLLEGCVRPPTGPATASLPRTVPSPRPSAWWNTATSASSRRPGCRVASTWRSD